MATENNIENENEMATENNIENYSELDESGSQIDAGESDEYLKYSERIRDWRQKCEERRVECENNIQEIDRYIQIVWDVLLDIREKYGKWERFQQCLHPQVQNRIPESDDPHELQSSIPNFLTWTEVKESIDRFVQSYNRRHMDFTPLRYPPNVSTCSIGAEYDWRDVRMVSMIPFFKKFLMEYCPQELYDAWKDYWLIYPCGRDDPVWYEDAEMTRLKIDYIDRHYSFLDRLFVKYLQCDRVDRDAKRDLVTMCNPLNWYPRPTDIKRNIIYHYGPTNSGKTFEAMQRFKGAESAIYCAPLRLLAMQIYQDVKYGRYSKQPCDLHTGEDRKCDQGSNKLSCTVELADLSRQWVVAVIDEIQLIGDPNRGGAWTRALLGLQAEEIHLCGDPSALQLVENICKLSGDIFTKVEHHRRSRLAVEDSARHITKRKIKARDCIVAFTEKDLNFCRKLVSEKIPKLTPILLYGSLPPEIKLQASALFGNLNNGVLIATDAVGMGLNLPIDRVIFFSLNKFDGSKRGRVKPSLVKQIAGRAGRNEKTGYCGATEEEDLKYLKDALDAPMESLAEAVVDFHPDLAPLLERIWRKMPTLSLLNCNCHLSILTNLASYVIHVPIVNSKLLFRFRKFDFLSNMSSEITKLQGNLSSRLTFRDYLKLCTCPNTFFNCTYTRRRENSQQAEERACLQHGRGKLDEWIANMFTKNEPCVADVEYGSEKNSFNLLTVYKFLYTQFPQHCHLFGDSSCLKEVEARINSRFRSNLFD